MDSHILTTEQLISFKHLLKSEEREQSTIEKYVREVRLFQAWLAGRAVTAEIVAGWKGYLRTEGYKPETINSKLSALNKFFKLMGWQELRIKYLKIQRKLFLGTEKELTKEEYMRLIETSCSLGKARLTLLIETICATGIRVSEVRYITAEAIQAGRTDIALKGKIRTILLPGKLCRKLQKYAKRQKITSGEIFLTRSGRGISRRQIWAEMKVLCKKASVAPSKVFPHNLRHLFARTFYRACRDVAKLADVLGHSNIETTRIYLISTGIEHARQLERLGLIS